MNVTLAGDPDGADERVDALLDTTARVQKQYPDLLESDLPRSIPIMRSYDRMTEAFPSTGASHEIAVRVPAAQVAQAKAAVDDLLSRLARDPRLRA